MKSQILKLSFMIAIAALALTGCRKENTSLDDSQSAEDNTQVSNALNSTADDATNAISANHALSGKTDGFENICGATVTIDSTNGIATIVFNGNDCNNKVNRTGTLTVTLLGYANGTRWKDIGATLQLDFSNVKLTSNATGANVTLNGTHKIINVNGGLAWRIMDGLDQGTVIHKHVADNFTITFNDGSQRTWSVRRSRSFTNSGGVKTVTLSGDTTIDGINGVEAWGTNRNGKAFTGALTRDLVSNSTCGLYRPISGDYQHHVNGRSLDVLFGVDAQGDPISSGCAYGMKITYTNARGRSATKVVSYWF